MLLLLCSVIPIIQRYTSTFFDLLKPRDFLLLSLDKFLNPDVLELIFSVNGCNLHVGVEIAKRLMYPSFFETLFKGLLLSNLLNHGVKPILSLIFSPPLTILGNQCPLVAYLLLLFQKHKILLGCPLISSDIRREEVDPPFSTLFPLSLIEAHPFVDFPRNLLPLLLAVLGHELPQ